MKNKVLTVIASLVVLMAAESVSAAPVYQGTVTYNFAAFSTGAVFSLSVDSKGATNYEITFTADFTNPSWTYPPYISGIEFRFGSTQATTASLMNFPSGNWGVTPDNSTLSGGSFGTANCQSSAGSAFVCADDNHNPSPTPGADPTVGHKYSWVIDATYANTLSFNDVQIGALFMDCASSSSTNCSSQALPLLELPAGSVPEPSSLELVAIGMLGLVLLSRFRSRLLSRAFVRGGASSHK